MSAEIAYMTAEQLIDEISEHAQRRLGMTFLELENNYKERKLPVCLATTEIAILYRALKRAQAQVV